MPQDLNNVQHQVGVYSRLPAAAVKPYFDGKSYAFVPHRFDCQTCKITEDHKSPKMMLFGPDSFISNGEAYVRIATVGSAVKIANVPSSVSMIQLTHVSTTDSALVYGHFPHRTNCLPDSSLEMKTFHFRTTVKCLATPSFEKVKGWQTAPLIVTIDSYTETAQQAVDRACNLFKQLGALDCIASHDTHQVFGS